MRRQTKRFRWASLAVVLGGALGAGAGNGGKAETYEFVAFIPDPTADADYLEMLDSFEAYADYMRETGVGEFHVNYFTKLAEADTFVKKQRAEGRPPAVGVIHDMLFPLKADEWGCEPIASPVYKGSVLINYLVVAPRSNPAKSARDLKGQRLAVGRMWTETPDLLGLLLFGELVKPGEHFKTLVTVDDMRQALVSVMRREADAALVHKPFYDAAQRRNREVWKEFKVVDERPAMRIAPVVAFKGAPADLVEKVKAVLYTPPEQGADAYKHLLSTFQLDGFKPASRADFADEQALVDKLPGRRPPAAGVPTTPAPTTAAPVAPATRYDEAKDVKVEKVDVERDADTGEITVVARFKGLVPTGMKALVSLDEGPEKVLPLECAEQVCVLTLPAAEVKGKGKLALQLLQERDGKTLSVGARKSYPVGASK